MGVERVVVNILVVYTILLSTSDTTEDTLVGAFFYVFCNLDLLHLHLQPLLHWGSALEVALGLGNVVLLGLFGQIDHVRGEEGLAVLLEVGLIGILVELEYFLNSMNPNTDHHAI